MAHSKEEMIAFGKYARNHQSMAWKVEKAYEAWMAGIRIRVKSPKHG